MAQDCPQDPSAATPGGRVAPRLPSVLVDRRRLHDRVGPDSGAAWSLVVGPAGSGKTTLVRSWVAERREPWAWISLDQAQDDPGRLVALVVQALQKARPEEPYDALDSLHMGGPDGLLRSLIDELDDDGRDEATVLVIDDAHHLGTQEWELLAWLLAHLPPSLHVVITSRVDPPMALGRERASGRMAEVRGEHLAFDLEETRRLVDAALGGGDPPAVARLHAQTQGWAVGLRLAILACADSSDLGRVMARFDGTHTTVAEYLLEEVLDRLPGDVRSFLLECSVAPVLGAGLAETLTGRHDAGDVLEGLAEDGVFLTPTHDGLTHDGDREYRFHPMLADLLRHELRRHDADGLRAQHLQAAEWYLARDRAIEAVEHLLEAHEHERAHLLVLEYFADLYRGHHRLDLPRWLRAVPDRVVEASLDRALRHCRALALLAEPSAREWYRYCDARVPDDDPRRAELLTLMALHHGIAGDLEQLRDHWERARRRRPAGTVDVLDEIVATWEVRLEAHFGDPDVAVELARTLLASERTLLGDAPALSILAGALDAAHRPDDAVAVARTAIQRWRDDGEPDLPAMTDALVVAASDRRRSARLDEAEDLLGLARALTGDFGEAHLLGALTALERAEVDRARGRDSWRGDLVALAEILRMAGPPAALVGRVEAAAATPDTEPTQPAEPLRGAPPEPLVEPLTDRELTILRAMASHLTFPEIGRELHISRHTVKSHAQHVYQKLGVASRSEAVAEARRIGLLAG